jgi:AcrR family transcriptional regulator
MVRSAPGVTGAKAGDGMAAAPEARPMRADAVRNRRRILRAAEEVFAERGVSVPIDDVAERAGVGVGTLYRHFPTKEALFEAIVLTRLQELIDALDELSGSPDPGQAFFAFLVQLAEQVSLKRDLFDALGTAGVDIKSKCAERAERLDAGIGELLDRAQRAGAVRADVEAGAIKGLVVGTCLAAEQPAGDADSRKQMLEIVCDGLRARPTGQARA